MDHWRRYLDYQQEKGISIEKYAREKFRLFIISRLNNGRFGRLLRKFTTFEQVDKFILKWKQGDLNLRFFSKGPAACIDLQDTISFFWPFIEGLKRKSFQESMRKWWFEVLFEEGPTPTCDEILNQTKEFRRQRKEKLLEKRERKQDLTPSQARLLENMMANSR